jgi:choline dehydrogenase
MASVVVVGAGAAGCLVAAQLAEANWDVVLVEAGPDLRGNEPPQLRDGWGIYREHAWGYVGVADAAGTTTDVLRTRLVGGTAWSTRFALRNHPADYDRWDRLVGGGWSHAEVHDAFNAIESDMEYGTAGWHGSEGPIPITRYPDVESTEFDAAIQAALRARQFDRVPDLNRPGATGFGRMPMNSVAGRRTITVDLLNKSYPNLEVRSDSIAVDVVFEGQRAAGIRVNDGSIIEAGTVVLAAGVYGSPCLLMRSGIGPANLIEQLGIEVRADLPGVGENLCDHPAVSLDSGYRGRQRPGPVLHTLATFSSVGATADGEGPDLALWASDPEGDPAEGWLDVLLWRPQGRGRVLITSTDPTRPPRIRLPEPTDQDVLCLCHGVRRALDVLTSSAFRSICGPSPQDVPQERQHLHAWTRANIYSLPHTVGTCAMGESPARGAVVNPAGQVHGVDGIYVADASILPGPPTGFPHLVALMMASRIAAGILHGPDT